MLLGALLCLNLIAELVAFIVVILKACLPVSVLVFEPKMEQAF